jgi:hypothetical protein
MGAYCDAKWRPSRYSSIRKTLLNKRCIFGEFEGGKLKGRRDYWDYAALAKQLAGEKK